MKSTLVIRAALLLVFAFCLWQLTDEQVYAKISKPHSNGGSSLETIGTVTTSDGDVRMRYPLDLVWFPVRDNTQVYNGAKIYTGPEAKAQVEFDAGAIVAIAPDSVVELQKIDQHDSVRVRSGQVDLSASKPGTIQYASAQSEFAPIRLTPTVIHRSATQSSKPSAGVGVGDGGLGDDRAGSDTAPPPQARATPEPIEKPKATPIAVVTRRQIDHTELYVLLGIFAAVVVIASLDFIVQMRTKD